MKILFAVFALFFSVMVQASGLNDIIVFGDSLSDNGNLYEYMKHKLPPSPPYYGGRFADGPVWIELIAKQYFGADSKKRLLDYAYGGAGISEDESDTLFTLKREITSYLIEHEDKADSNSLYIIWIGSNNYLGVPDDPEQSLIEVNAGIVNGLERLIKAGAKHFLVVNAPDLGRTPLAIEFKNEEIMTYLSSQHNERLTKSVKELTQRYPGTQWLFFDVHAKLNEVLAAPGKYGFSNITDTCYNTYLKEPKANLDLYLAASIQPRDNYSCAGYLFFDPVHPTAAAHRIIASEAKILFDAAGIKFGKS